MQYQTMLGNYKKPLIVVGISAAFVGLIVLIYIWFRFNWPLWVLITLMLIGIVLLILLIRVGYTAHWTGFKGKTIWDWLQLLAVIAIPLVVVGATMAFGVQQANLAQKQHDSDQQRSMDQQQAAILQTYIDNIQDLLLNHKLLKSRRTDDVAILARARTLTALQGLDPERKGRLLIFLHEAQLIGFQDNKAQVTIIDLSGADLTNAALHDTDLIGANLSNTDLYGALLYRTDLRSANLQGADLRSANLQGATLSNANLQGATLTGADLDCTKPGGEKIICADLSNIDLRSANLQGAMVTSEQLAKARSLKGATMPDGSIHP